MANLKDTLVLGKLTVTDSIIADKFIKNNGTSDQILLGDGSTTSLNDININIANKLPLTGGTMSGGISFTGGTNGNAINSPNHYITAKTTNINGSSYNILVQGTNANTAILNRTKNQFIQDLGLSQVYNYKGTITWTQLKEITSAKVGDVYFISGADGDGLQGQSWACKEVFNLDAGTGNNYATYWQSIGGSVDLSGYVTKDTSQIITGQKTFNNTVTFNEDVLLGVSDTYNLGTSTLKWKNIYATTFVGNVNGTFDGIAPTGFLRYYNAAGTLPSGVTLNTVNTPTYLYTVSASGGWESSSSTKPTGIDNALGILHVHVHRDNYATQLGFGCTTGKMYFRNAYSSATFGDWQTLLASNNYTDYTVTKDGTGATGTWGISITGNASSATKATQDGDGNTIKNTYLNLAGGTMSGILTLKGSQYTDSYSGALNANNSNIYGLNSIYTADLADSSAEGIHFYRTSTTVDSLWAQNGVLYFTPNRTLGGTATNYKILHSGGGKLDGPLTFANGPNGVWNIVGDDSMFGDQNVAGAFCIKGNNGATTLRMYSYDTTVTTTANFQYNTSDKCIDVIFN